MVMKSKHKIMISLSTKLTVMIVLMALTIGTLTTVFGYQFYKRSMEEHYISLGQNLAKTAARIVDGGAIDNYIETLKTDAEYDHTLAFMRALKRDNDIAYLYVVKPTEKGAYYVYDTDESEEQLKLGDFEEWYDSFIETSKLFLKGEEKIAPVMSNESFGWLLSVYEPIHDESGRVAGYVGADFSMDKVIKDRDDFLMALMAITASITALFSIFYLYVVKTIVVYPINKMAKAADNFLIENLKGDGSSKEECSFSKLDIKTNDELETLADAMKSMNRKINEYVYNLDVATKKSEIDVLTKLYNRDSFEQRINAFLATENADGQIHAFVMIDVDHFKQVNDIYGHIAGDNVLIQCGAALKSAFRNADEAARLGGDEFAVFCKSIGDVETILAKLEHLRETWRNIRVGDSAETCISASIGVALVPRDGMSYQELYKKADLALYEAKRQGRDRCIVYSENLDIAS